VGFENKVWVWWVDGNWCWCCDVYDSINSKVGEGAIEADGSWEVKASLFRRLCRRMISIQQYAVNQCGFIDEKIPSVTGMQRPQRHDYPSPSHPHDYSPVASDGIVPVYF